MKFPVREGLTEGRGDLLGHVAIADGCQGKRPLLDGWGFRVGASITVGGAGHQNAPKEDMVGLSNVDIQPQTPRSSQWEKFRDTHGERSPAVAESNPEFRTQVPYLESSLGSQVDSTGT